MEVALDLLDRRRRSENMRRIRSTHTSPELAVRKIARGLGLRYRLHAKQLPGRPDLVFPAQKKAVLIHGCFWHQHRNCADGKVPKSNRAYWVPKLARNKARDIQHKRALTILGWRYLVLWECEIEGDERKLIKRIQRFLSAD